MRGVVVSSKVTFLGSGDSSSTLHFYISLANWLHWWRWLFRFRLPHFQSRHDMTQNFSILFDSSYELDSSIFIGWCYAYDNFNISLARFTGSFHASWEFQLCMSCSGCISLNNLMFYRVTSDIMTDDICLENDDISAYRNVTHFNYYEGNTRRALDVTYFPR